MLLFARIQMVIDKAHTNRDLQSHIHIWGLFPTLRSTCYNSFLIHRTPIINFKSMSEKLSWPPHSAGITPLDNFWSLFVSYDTLYCITGIFINTSLELECSQRGHRIWETSQFVRKSRGFCTSHTQYLIHELRLLLLSQGLHSRLNSVVEGERIC